MDEKIWDFITKRLSDEETPNSKIGLDLWLAESVGNRQKYDEAKSLWNSSAKVAADEPEIPFQLFAAQLIKKPEPKPKTITLFWKYGVAAAIAIAFTVGVLNYSKSKQQHQAQTAWVVKKAGAGQIIKLELPDGSFVWLNSGSQISFASTLSSEPKRIIKLTGEAYFEVKHDEKHPFIVKSGELTTTVYGTSFTVRAYKNEATSSVGVNSGRVGVIGTRQKNRSSAVMLLPSDQLTYNSQTKNFSKLTIPNTDVDAFTRRELVFEQTPIEEVVKTLSRTYNVQIDASKIVGSGCRLTGRFNNQPLQVILQALQLSLQIKSVQTKEAIYLKGGNCM